MTLEPEQIEFRGLVMGPGTDYFIDQVEGLAGYEARTSDADSPRNDGALRGRDYLAPRTIALDLALIEADGLDGSVYEGLWAVVRDTFRPSRDTDYDLTFRRPGDTEKLVRCRPIQLTRSEPFGNYSRVGHPPIVLRAADPRIYSADLRSGNIPVYGVSSAGMDLPVVNFPVEFTGSGGGQIEFVAANAGTADAYPLLRFYGPVTGTCTGVTVTNTTTGQVLSIGTTVLTGQILTADMEAAVTGANRLVISLDGSTRYGSWALPREAFAIAPGSNTLKFEVTGTSSDMMALIQYRDTWLS